jgi:hypothetical protein
MKILKFYNEKTLTILFILWLSTFFFGSMIGSVSIGFMTLYPNLILSLILLVPSLIMLRRFNNLFKLHFLFISVFILYTLIWLVLNPVNYFSLFELRSHVITLFTFLILIFFSKNFTWEKFNEILRKILWSWFFILIVFGFLEIFLGMHFKGVFTNKISALDYSIADYSPIFIFDNPNDFMLNCLGVLFLLIIVDKTCFLNRWKLFFILALLFLLSIYAQARIAKIILIILALIVIFKEYRFVVKKIILNNKYILLFLFLLILQFCFNKIVSIKEDKKPFVMLNNINCVKKYSHYYEFEDISKWSDYDKILIERLLINKNTSTGFNSSDIRMKLTQNGLYLIQHNPFLGVGPGQFQYYNLTKKVPEDIGENSSPHNYILELISNYGLLGLGYLVYLLVLFIQCIRFKTETSFRLSIVLMLFLIASFMPSAFIYQPINMLFTAIWVIYYYKEKSLIYVK